MYWTLFSIIVLVIYISLILYYYYQWGQLKELDSEEGNNWSTKVSVIIIGRNEGERLIRCLKSIAKNSYPPSLYEIIYVDDHSTDASLQKAGDLNIPNLKLLDLTERLSGQRVKAYKKEAIKYALSVAVGELILHTDADTLLKKEWISSHVTSFKKNDARFTAAPVLILPGQGFLTHFQSVDFFATMGITGAGIQSGLQYMANGANMSYDAAWRKKLLDGFQEEYASGDDMFLIQKAADEDQNKVHFIKKPSSLAFTYAEKNWSEFFRQRFRWASKAGAYTDPKIKMIAGLVFLVNILLVIQLILSLIIPGQILLFFILVLMKFMVDVLFISRIAGYYSTPLNGTYLLLSLLFYPIYYITTGIIAILPMSISWKGRKIK